MARRTTRNGRRRTRKATRRRRTRRNPKYVVANRRRSRGSRRRVRRNPFAIFGTDPMKVAMMVAAGGVGFIGARYLGNVVAMKDWGTTDPRIAKTAAAAIGIPATFMLARKSPAVSQNSGAIVLGMGLAAAEAWLRDTPLLGGSPAAAALMEDLPPAASDGGGAAASDATAASGLSSYYDYPMNREGQALSDDHYTAQMLGNTADPGNQANVEMASNGMEAVTTVIPTDLAMRANTMPQWSKVNEGFANSGDRGHAGGVFSRHLFSGMMGS